MRPFRARRDGTVSAEFSAAEVAVLADLGAQFSGMLSEGDGDDPAMRRLLPDAYPDDSEASAEFRRFTSGGLLEGKLANASALLASIEAGVATTDDATDRPTKVRLDPAAAQAWLRSLGDLRLTIAVRLGIEQDGDDGDLDDPLVDLYDWLGFVQGTLVDALDSA